MKLTIHTPFYQAIYSIAWLEINTPTGNYVIQEGHVPAIMSLTSHQPLIFRLTTGKEETITVDRGVVKIERLAVTLIITTLKD